VKNLWQSHRALTLSLVGVALAALVVGGYLVLKRPEDVSNEDAAFEEPVKQEKEVELADWPYYGRDMERTRYLNAPVKPPYKVVWRINGRKLLEYSPVYAEGSLYTINNNGEAFAVKAKTGKVRWRREVATRNASSPAYHDGTLYLSNLEPGQVLALNAKNGRPRWKRELPGRTESSPVVVGDRLITGCECGTLFAFDKETGKTLWETDLPGEVKAAPAVSEGVAYVGDYSGVFSAVNVRDGSIKWQSDSLGGSFGQAGDFYSTAAVAFGRVYVASKDGRVYSFEKDTGNLAWAQTIGGELYAGIVAADTPKTQPTVYLGSYTNGGFHALDARTGSERWSTDAGGPVIGAASVVGETVYFANLDETVTRALDARTGNEVWNFRDGAYNPVISDGERIYLTGYKFIYALRETKPGEKDSGGTEPKGKKKKG
jgi:outer membrane protein assembly factor BamB